MLGLGVEVYEEPLGFETLEVDFGVEHVRELRREPRGGARAEPLAPQVGAPVADAEADALAGAHAPEDDLCAVRAFARSRAVVEAAFYEIVDLFHEGRLAFGPQTRVLVSPHGEDLFGASAELGGCGDRDQQQQRGDWNSSHVSYQS